MKHNERRSQTRDGRSPRLQPPRKLTRAAVIVLVARDGIATRIRNGHSVVKVVFGSVGPATTDLLLNLVQSSGRPPIDRGPLNEAVEEDAKSLDEDIASLEAEDANADDAGELDQRDEDQSEGVEAQSAQRLFDNQSETFMQRY